MSFSEYFLLMLFLVIFCCAANMVIIFFHYILYLLLLVFKGAIDFSIFTFLGSVFITELFISVNGILIDSLKQCLSLNKV